MEKEKANDDDILDAITVIQEALIDLYLNVKVRSKDEINDYNSEDLTRERENLYSTSPIDLINYIQTSVEILMNIKVEDYICNSFLSLFSTQERERAQRQNQEAQGRRRLTRN